MKGKIFRLITVILCCVSLAVFAFSGCVSDNDKDSGDGNVVASGDNTGDKPGDNTGDNTGDKPGDNTGDNTGNNPGDNTGDKPGDNTENEAVGDFQVTYDFDENHALNAAWVANEVSGIVVDIDNATVPDKDSSKSAEDGFSRSRYMLLENGNYIKITVTETVILTVYTSHTNGSQNRTLYLTYGEPDAPAHANTDIIITKKSVNGKAENGKLYAVTATVEAGEYYLSADSVGGMHVYAIIITGSTFSCGDKGDSGNTEDNTGSNSGNTGDNSGGKTGGNIGNPDEPVVNVYEDEKNGVHPEVTAASIWLSPNGNDNNGGSQSAPLYSLAKAVEKATAGTTIFCMVGVYNYTKRVDLAQSGTADKPIIIQAYNWGEVEFNFSGQEPGNNSTTAVGLYLTGSYWKLHGITVCYAGDNGIKIEGSYNYLGRCTTHHNLDTGVQLGFGHDKKNPGGVECSNNLIENCDSYLNCDHDSNFGADADGFACKMYAGVNNAFRGCRAWRNSDDNWDLYEMDYSVLIENCWAWEAGKKADFTGANNWVQKRVEPFGMKYRGDGSFNGNGNGIKLGGNSSNGVQVVKNCVSFGHNKTSSVKGFDQNHNAGGIYITNCVAWDNGYNYMLDDSSKFGHSILNSLSFYYPQNGKPSTRNAGELVGTGVVENCNFELNSSKGDLKHNTTYGTLTEDDFITLSEEAAMAPRRADGSLPNNGFAKLKTTSPFYGKGMGLI